jgi:hypothetical protein
MSRSNQLHFLRNATVKNELNDLTTFDNYDMNGWRSEGAPSTIEKSGSQFNLVRHESEIPFINLSKSLPLESHREYVFRFTGEGRHPAQLTIVVPPNEHLARRDIIFQGLNAVVTVPFKTGKLETEETTLHLVWSPLADHDQDRTFKLGELHIVGVPPER